VPFKWLLINLTAAWKTTSRWGGAATEFLNELLRHNARDMFSLRQGEGEVEDKITHKSPRVQISDQMSRLGMSFKRETSMRERVLLEVRKTGGVSIRSPDQFVEFFFAFEFLEEVLGSRLFPVTRI
jgi:hypothetical protein